MKKIWGTVLTVSVCLGVLSGCGGGNAETVSDSTVTFAEIASEISETTSTKTTKTETSKPETAEETTTEADQELPYKIIDMSNYTGNFYEWKYDYDIVAYDRESFAGGEDILAAAEKVLEDKDDLRFEEGVWEDFDGDGKKEGFLLYTCGEKHEYLGYRFCYVVFADADGSAELLENSSGVCGNLNPMRYNGFIHMCTDFGASIATTHMEIYAVEENSAAEKYDDFFRGKPLDGAFILVPHPQGGGNSIMFWNEQRLEYCQLVSDRITEDDINDILESEAFAGSSYAEMATAEMDKASIVRTVFFMYGGKYFFPTLVMDLNGAAER